jgi:hypothetical protein
MGLKGFTETSVPTQQFKERLILEDGTERFFQKWVITQKFKERLILEDGVERFCRNVGTYATIQGVFDP